MMAFLRWYARWPLWLLHGLGWALGWLTVALSPTYRRRLWANARLAGVSPADTRAAVGEAGRMVTELPWLWLAPPGRRVADWVEWRGAEWIDWALGQGKGMLLMTPHLGTFELCAQAYAERFGDRATLTALYRPARKPWLKTLQETSRARAGLDTAPASLLGVRQMMRALRKGQVVGLLPDQVPPDGLGVWAPFFGQNAYTMTLSARLLAQTGAVPLLMWCERRAWGRGWVLHVFNPLDGADPATPVDPARVNAWMEGLIRQRPGQYLWGYHRFKQPRGLPPELKA